MAVSPSEAGRVVNGYGEELIRGAFVPSMDRVMSTWHERSPYPSFVKSSGSGEVMRTGIPRAAKNSLAS